MYISYTFEPLNMIFVVQNLYKTQKLVFDMLELVVMPNQLPNIKINNNDKYCIHT